MNLRAFQGVGILRILRTARGRKPLWYMGTRLTQAECGRLAPTDRDKPLSLRLSSSLTGSGTWARGSPKQNAVDWLPRTGTSRCPYDNPIPTPESLPSPPTIFVGPFPVLDWLDWRACSYYSMGHLVDGGSFQLQTRGNRGSKPSRQDTRSRRHPTGN